MPWQALYNAACLYAMSAPGAGLADRNAHDAVELLRLAISDVECELDRPTEWLSADPDLRSLRARQEFRGLIREQASRDFSPAADNDVAGPWLRELLPALPAGSPPVAVCGPTRMGWFRSPNGRRSQRS